MNFRNNLAARVFALTALTAIGTGAQAQSFSENGLTFIIGGDSVVVKAQSKTEENVVIPDTAEYTSDGTTTKYAVKGIAASGFFGCKAMISIVLPTTITNIARAAFWNCSKLEALTIPEKVTAINNAVFTGCRSLKQLNIGKNLNYIEPGSFMYCTALDNIYIAEENQNFKSVGGNVYSKDGASLIAHAGSAEALSIPDGVETIRSSAFWYCESLKSVTFAASVKTIENDAFNGSGLTSVSIPQTVESIGDFAFAECRNLDTVRVEWQTPPTITTGTFSNCNRNLIVPEGTLDIYKATTGWQSFRNISELTGIDLIKTNGEGFETNTSGKRIRISAKGKAGKFTICSILGEKLQTFSLKKGETATSKALPVGIYIIYAGKNAQKAIIK